MYPMIHFLISFLEIHSKTVLYVYLKHDSFISIKFKQNAPANSYCNYCLTSFFIAVLLFILFECFTGKKQHVSCGEEWETTSCEFH